MATADESASTHWSRPHLGEAMLEAAATSGIDLHTATPDDLAYVEQFHGGGKDATRALAQQAAVAAGMHVLDVGGGVGGPARMLAAEYGAQVTVLDLTHDYLHAGTLVTERMGLTAHVRFRHGNALDLPYPDASFDLVWTQNSGMNIGDKAQLYRGFFRVLRPGGRLAQLEPVAGPIQPPHFPLMWACEPADTHLLSAAALREVILATGFIERHWNPVATFPGAAAQRAQAAMTIQRLVMGDRLPAIQEANVRNIEEDRIHTVLAVFEHP